MTRLGIGSAHVRTLNGRELMKSPEWRQGRPRDPRSGEIDRQWVRWKVSCLFVLGRSPLFKFSERRSKKAFKYHRAQPTCESFPSSGAVRERERERMHSLLAQPHPFWEAQLHDKAQAELHFLSLTYMHASNGTNYLGGGDSEEHGRQRCPPPYNLGRGTRHLAMDSDQRFKCSLWHYSQIPKVEIPTSVNNHCWCLDWGHSGSCTDPKWLIGKELAHC